MQILFTPFNKDIAALTSYKRFWSGKTKLVYQQHMKIGVSKKDIVHTFRYNMLDLWISPLEYLRLETLEKTKVPAERITVIPFGLETSQFTSKEISKADARQRLGLPPDVFLVGVLGRIDPKKGQDFLIHALKHLEREVDKNIHLLIMGDITPKEGDGFLKKLHELVKYYKLDKKVHFRSYDPEVMLFYRSVDVFAMPAHGETFGMVTIEAMAAGVPVVGVDRDGTRELLGKGLYGFLHELEDLVGFISAIRSVRESGELPAMLERAHRQAVDHYDAVQMVDRIDKALSDLI